MKIGKLLNSVAKQGKNLSDNVAKLFYNVTEMVGKRPSFVLGVMDSVGKKKWGKVFENGIKPKDLLNKGPLKKKFAKDKGIPESWPTKPSKKGDGIIFQEPGNPHTDIRVMPGKTNSPYKNSRKSYVEVKKDGRWLDKNGNKLPDNNNDSAHIPLDEFKFPF